MNRPIFITGNRPHFIYRLPNNIDNTSQCRMAYRHGNLLAGIEDFLSPDQTIRRIHGDGPNGVFTQMLGNLNDQIPFLIIDGRIGNFKSRINLRKISFLELYVNNWANDLRNLSFIH